MKNKPKFKLYEKVRFKEFCNIIDEVIGIRKGAAGWFEYCFKDNINAWYCENELKKYKKERGRK